MSTGCSSCGGESLAFATTVVTRPSARRGGRCGGGRDAERSGEGTAGYGLDLGVLSGGQTALVEWNDGFSLGAYELDSGSLHRPDRRSVA